jgi:hypothetical protein
MPRLHVSYHLSQDLVRAAAGGGGSQRTVDRVMRHDLRNARQLREEEVQAEKRLASALGAWVALHPQLATCAKSV